MLGCIALAYREYKHYLIASSPDIWGEKHILWSLTSWIIIGMDTLLYGKIEQSLLFNNGIKIVM